MLCNIKKAHIFFFFYFAECTSLLQLFKATLSLSLYQNTPQNKDKTDNTDFNNFDHLWDRIKAKQTGNIFQYCSLWFSVTHLYKQRSRS